MKCRGINFGFFVKTFRLLLLLLLFILRVYGYAEIYYVSPAGLDSNDGSLLHPWASPGYGSRQIASGDTLLILGGSYVIHQFDDDIIIPPSGSAVNWTTIIGEAGNRPILKGSDNLLAAMILSGKSYLRIENIEITSDDGALFRDGIQIMGGGVAEYIAFNNLYIHHLDEFGMDFGDINHVTIRGCRITHCGFGAIGGPAGEVGGWRNVVINGCYLAYSGHYYQGSAGPGPYDRPDGFGIEPSAGPVEIINTTAEHNRGDGLDSKAQNTFIQRCTVANNSCDGIKLWGGGSKVENCLIYGRGDGVTTSTPWAAIVVNTDQANSTFTFVNTTVDDYLGLNYFIYMQYDNPGTPINLIIRNCIFSSRGDNSFIYLAPAITATIEYSLFYFPGKTLVLEHGGNSYDAENVAEIGAGNIYGDPLFIAPAFGTVGDYHLNPASPALDAGTTISAPDRDLDGVTRPQNGVVDIGCYELRNTPVPVELFQFTLTLVKEQVVLDWQSISENNCYGYLIERQIPGENRFRKIAFIAGNGTSACKSFYQYIDPDPVPGLLLYRLVQVDYDGKMSYYGPVQVDYAFATGFDLAGNYPNPFNTETNIRVTIPKAGKVSLTIYNSAGSRVYGQVGNFTAGEHTLMWNGRDEYNRVTTSGLYFFRVQFMNQSHYGKMLLLR